MVGPKANFVPGNNRMTARAIRWAAECRITSRASGLSGPSSSISTGSALSASRYSTSFTSPLTRTAITRSICSGASRSMTSRTLVPTGNSPSPPPEIRHRTVCTTDASPTGSASACGSPAWPLPFLAHAQFYWRLHRHWSAVAARSRLSWTFGAHVAQVLNSRYQSPLMLGPTRCKSCIAPLVVPLDPERSRYTSGSSERRGHPIRLAVLTGPDAKAAV